MFLFICLLLFFHTAWANINGIACSTIGQTTFFATKPSSHKIIEADTKRCPAELCARYTEQTDQWYADGCKNNQTLNTLVDAVIAYFQKNPIYAKDKRNAVIFDIDETVLSSYQAFYNKISRSPSRAPAYLYAQIFDKQKLFKIEPIARLYQFFIDQKCTIFFVCGRSESKEHRTTLIENLHYHGFSNFEHLYLRPIDCSCAIPQWKESIRETIAKNYTIIATIDDDWRNVQGKCLGLCAVWVPSLLTQRPQEDIFYEKISTSLSSVQQPQQPVGITTAAT